MKLPYYGALRAAAPLRAFAFITCTSLLLSACENSADASGCVSTSDNYIQDTDFELERENRRSKHWTATQHAGEPSFEVLIEDGVLTITKTGTQPWFIYRQRLQNSEFAGARMAFSAQIKLDVAPAVRVFGRSGAGLSAVMRSGNKQILMRSSLDHEPHMGKTDWTDVELVFDIPADTDSIDLSFLHQAEGSFQVRNPSFHKVKTSSGTCQPTAIIEES